MPTRTPIRHHGAGHHGPETRAFPRPLEISPDYRGSGKLEGKIALITGGAGGLGRSIAIHFAREGADIVVVHGADEDPETARQFVEDEGRRYFSIEGDVGSRPFSRACVRKVLDLFGRLDVVVNGVFELGVGDELKDLSEHHLERAFRTNFFSSVFIAQAAVPFLAPDSCIINTTISAPIRGDGQRMESAALKGAMEAFTRSLARSLAEDGIRVNAVAPGPIWTPRLPEYFEFEDLPAFGRDTLLGRPGHPSEVAPAYVFLASGDASYITGQVIHPNGGENSEGW